MAKLFKFQEISLLKFKILNCLTPSRRISCDSSWSLKLEEGRPLKERKYDIAVRSHVLNFLIIEKWRLRYKKVEKIEELESVKKYDKIHGINKKGFTLVSIQICEMEPPYGSGEELDAY